MRYIGSKARVVEDILEIIGPPRDDGFFVDGFCGTGIVADRAADYGWPIRLNDHLPSAVVISRARLLATEQVSFARWGGYREAIDWFNDLRPSRGYFWREYGSEGAAGRRYFTPSNAAHIDSVRENLLDLEIAGVLTKNESTLLRADLIAAAGRVANIAGTYGCYLSGWTGAALQDFHLQARALRSEAVEHRAYCGDVVDAPIGEQDVAYFDPPYTKRQYAAYYHINETLAIGDEPKVGGKTGLRPWQDRASDYCYKRRALGALVSLVRNTAARRIFLSYSSQGHVPLNELSEALIDEGDLTLHKLGAVGRYRPNRAASRAGARVSEYLIELTRAPIATPAF